MIPGFDEGNLSGFREPSRHAPAEFRMGVDPRSHGGASDGQFVESRQRSLHALHGQLDLSRPAADLLAQTDRHRIHQVGPAGLDDIVALFRALSEGLAQML